MSKSRVPDLSKEPFPHWMPVIEATCDEFSVAWREVLAGYTDRRVCRCRHEIWARVYEQFRSSYSTIGARTGGYDHSTVRSGVMRARRQAA